MQKNPYAPDLKDLPQTLPIFPLADVLLLPRGNLPLNIFEPRYVAMIDDALSSNRLIGMIQPKDEKDKSDDRPIFDVGCAGKITEFIETPDGRYEITLSGVSRFRVAGALKSMTPYRQITPLWEEYQSDLKSKTCLNLNREKLKGFLRAYFIKQGMDCDWQAIDDADDGKLITCLSMVCPFTACEKQALLEAKCCDARAEMFMSMLEMAARNNCTAGHQH